MPNLARTPPQRVSPLPRSPLPASAPDPAASTDDAAADIAEPAPVGVTPVAPARDSRQSAGDASLPSIASPTRAFAPRNPGVMRSPPAGGQSQEPYQAVQATSEQEQDAVPIGVPDIEVQEASLVDIDTSATGAGDTSDVDMAAGEGEASTAGEAVQGGDKRKRADDEDFIDQQLQAGLSTDPAGIATSTTPTLTPPAKRQSIHASNASTTPAAAQPTTVEPVMQTRTPAASSSSRTSHTSPTAAVPAHAPQTPSSKHRRRSTRTAAEVAEAASIINAPIEPLEGSEEYGRYGRRYATTMEILEAASKAAAMRWTKKDLEQCFPLISAAHPGTMKEVWEDTAKALQAEILSSARQCFDSQDTGLALKMLQEAVEEAKEYKKKEGGRRSDAWRPDLTPHGITAAANMAIYDDAYDKLLMEYTGLHKDCTTRFASIKAKRAELAAFETGVSDGVVELEKSLEVIADFPTADMKEWAEGKMDEMNGVRLM